MTNSRELVFPDSPNGIGMDLAGPILLRWGTDQQKERFVRRIITHEDRWCELFSEPGAGSDLASLSTRAIRDGEEWCITGQKVWSSLAHQSDYGLLIGRTDPDVPKHEGITAFIISMKAPGVEVRPLRQMTGDADFNEVFLTDVRVPDEHRVGPVGRGWDVARSVLAQERAAGRGRSAVKGGIPGRSVESVIEHYRPISDPELCGRLVHYPGLHLVTPLVDSVAIYDVRDKVYTTTAGEPTKKEKAGEAAAPEVLTVQAKEGLPIGMAITVRYRLDAGRLVYIHNTLPREVDSEVVQPVIGSTFRGIAPNFTVREVFAVKREEIRQRASDEIVRTPGADGIVVKEVMLREVQLPPEYAEGLEGLLLKEQEDDEMGVQAEIKQKEVRRRRRG